MPWLLTKNGVINQKAGPGSKSVFLAKSCNKSLFISKIYAFALMSGLKLQFSFRFLASYGRGVEIRGNKAGVERSDNGGQDLSLCCTQTKVRS